MSNFSSLTREAYDRFGTATWRVFFLLHFCSVGIILLPASAQIQNLNGNTEGIGQLPASITDKESYYAYHDFVWESYLQDPYAMLPQLNHITAYAFAQEDIEIKLSALYLESALRSEMGDDSRADSIAMLFDQTMAKAPYDAYRDLRSKEIRIMNANLREDYIHAMSLVQEMVPLYEALGESLQVGICLSNVASYYDMFGDYESSMEWSARAFEISPDTLYSSYFLHDMARTCQKMHKTDSAIYFAKKSIEMVKTLPQKQNLSNLYSLISEVKYNEGAIESAQLYADSALLYLPESMTVEKGIVLVNTAKLEINNGQTNQAKKRLDEVLDFALTMQIGELVVDASRALELWSIATQNWDSLKRYGNLNHQYNDSLFSFEKGKEMADEYGTKLLKNEARIKKLMLAQKDEERNKIKNYFIIAIVALAAVLLALFLIVRYSLLLRKSRNKVSEKNTVLEQTTTILQNRNFQVEQSLNYARSIQQATTISEKGFKAFFPKSCIVYKPTDIVSGDIYWSIKKSGKYMFSAIDCTGRGAPGGIVSILVQSILNEITQVRGITIPGKVLDTLNVEIAHRMDSRSELLQQGADMALCLYDREQNTIHFSGAKMDLYMIRNGEIFKTKGTRKSVGSKMPTVSFETHSIALEKGDKIYIFTDGFENQFGGITQKKLKRPALLDVLVDTSKGDMDEQKKKLDQFFDAWKGKTVQTDDVCLVGIEV